MDSPTPTPRRSRHAKSQSTSALSTILDDGPAFRDNAPSVPAIPSYLRSETPRNSPRKMRESYDRPETSLSGRQSHLPGLTRDLPYSRASSSQTPSDDDSSSSTPSRGMSRSRTLQSVDELGSPTPRRKSRRPIETLDDLSRHSRSTATSSPTKRRSRETNKDSPVDMDSKNDASGMGLIQKANRSQTPSESFESSLDSDLQKWMNVVGFDPISAVYRPRLMHGIAPISSYRVYRTS